MGAAATCVVLGHLSNLHGAARRYDVVEDFDALRADFKLGKPGLVNSFKVRFASLLDARVPAGPAAGWCCKILRGSAYERQGREYQA